MSWRPSVVILGPGGVKGYMEIGALALLQTLGTLEEVTKVVGVSVGAIIATMWVAGYKFRQMIAIASKLDLSTQVFRLDSLLKDGLISKGGLFGLQTIRETLTNLISAKFSFVPTLEQLYKLTGMELVLVTTNVSRYEALYLSHENRPNLSCVEAVLMSINIPLIFGYYELDGVRYVDGALSDPMPIQLAKNEPTLIVRIQDRLGSEESFFTYVYASLSVSMEVMAKEKLKVLSQPGFAGRCRLLSLETSEVNPVNPTLDLDGKRALIKEGYEIACKAIAAGFFRD